MGECETTESGNIKEGAQCDKNTSDIPHPNLCAVCSKPASKCCTGCRTIFYCSPEHQKQNWKVHKSQCSPFILRTSSDFGRHFVAARRLKATTLILEELPTLIAPRGMVDDYPLCLSCCIVLDERKNCSRCAWPMCSLSCEENLLHRENECSLFSKSKVEFHPPGYSLYEVYKVIEIIRGIFVKAKSPEVWKQMASLQSKTELESQTIFNDLKSVRNAFKLEDFGSDDDWNHILGIMNVNNFTMAGPRACPSISYEAFLFVKACMLAHSCAPNCWWGVTVYPEYKITVYVADDIAKGEIITVPYTYMYSSYGTHMRMELLKGNAEYVCKCRRCFDKTELGTYASALKCTSCEVGNVLPINPLDEMSDWKCETEHCKYELKCKTFGEMIEALIKKLENCESVENLVKFIEDNKDVSLHANHWLITEAMDTICKGEPTESCCVTEKIREKNRLIEYCQHILRVKNLVAPGISLERARLMNLLARLRYERLKIRTSNSLETNEAIKEESNLILTIYEEALLFYLNDRTQTPLEKKIGFKAAVIISDMTSIKTMYLKESDEGALGNFQASNE